MIPSVIKIIKFKDVKKKIKDKFLKVKFVFTNREIRINSINKRTMLELNNEL
jgi:hypothetical protein